MKVVECQHSELRVVERPEPVLEKGQVRLKVLRCGICGSDLHARKNMDQMADPAETAGYDRFGRSNQAVVFGHEFSGEVAEYGPGCKSAIPAGTTVVALPLVRYGKEIDATGLSVRAAGAYAEQVVAQESLMMAVPNGLAPDVAAVVASDYSAGRRDLARACGADVVVDPSDASPYTAAGDRGHIADIPAGAELLVGTREKLGRLPLGWWHSWRLIDKLGIEPKHPVIFECVGVPGIIDDIIKGAPLLSKVIVVGVCMAPDTITPTLAINKEIDLRFVVAYDPLEFRDTLHMLAEGKVNPRPLMTGEVGLDGVAAAFTALGDPEGHAKILVDPQSSVTEPA